MNISTIHDCYGCGLCATVCGKSIISMQLNADGFYEPHIKDLSACVDCGLCISVCSFANKFEPRTPFKSYAAWSKDGNQRKISTSGGVSAEIAKILMSNGYKFCGVRYNPIYNIAEHYIAKNTEEISASFGSKYIQSYTENAFLEIDRKQKYLVTGTPCQIASFRRYIQKFHCEENFVLVDFFCHGVPSKLMWDKYVNERCPNLRDIKHVSWRNKEKGWQNSYCVTIESSKGKHQTWGANDDFITLFIGDACLGKACYDSCKFKYDHSVADIRIGDLWGNTYSHDTEGVCAAIAFTERGEHVLHQANLELRELTFEEVAGGQMRHCAIRPWYYERTMKVIKSPDNSLSSLAAMVRTYKTILRQFHKIKKFVTSK